MSLVIRRVGGLEAGARRSPSQASYPPCRRLRRERIPCDGRLRVIRRVGGLEAHRRHGAGPA